MSELNTKTLSELTTVDSLLNTDTVLIESGGRMKKVSPSVIGGAGGGGGVMIIGGFAMGLDGPSGTSDKTWQEIDNALAAGVICVVTYTDEGGHGQMIIRGTTAVEGSYYIDAADFSAKTKSVDGYPTTRNGEIS